MKCHVSLALLMLMVTIMTVAIVSGAPQGSNCPSICTADYRPVCGFNGACYRQFGNPCTFSAQQCGQPNLVKVDQSKCDQAQSGTDPTVKKC